MCCHHEGYRFLWTLKYLYVSTGKTVEKDETGASVKHTALPGSNVEQGQGPQNATGAEELNGLKGGASRNLFTTMW